MPPKIAIFSSAECLNVCEDLVVRWDRDTESRIWATDIFAAGDITVEAIISTARLVDFAIFIFSCDDKIESRNKTYYAPRDNVIMEYGLCCGILGGNRAILLVEDRDDIKIPSNLNGITQIRFEKSNISPAANKLKSHFKKLGPSHSSNRIFDNRRIPGKRLFQHKGYYPISLIEGKNVPYLNKEIFEQSIEYLLNNTDDQLSALDLAFLRYDNLGHVEDLVGEDLQPAFRKLMEKYELIEFFENFEERKRNIFSNYIRLTNELGETFAGSGCEFLLHNVMNPIRSIIAAKNTVGISDRKLYQESTRFVVQFVKAQGADLMSAMETGGKIAYFKQFNKTKNVKATTTPFYDPKYGLVAILCVNIDIDMIENFDKEKIDIFFENYTRNSGETPDFEKDIANSLKN